MNAIAASLLGLLLAVPANAQEAQPPDTQAVRFEQHLDAPLPLELKFHDETGRTVQLSDYVEAGKPIILTLNYFHCPNFCTLVMDGLASGLKEVGLQMGKDFTVLTVSFDPFETPELAAAQKDLLARHYPTLGMETAWHFLTGDSPAIDSLTQAVGLHYVFDAAHNEYAHPAGIVVLTPEGKIARYLYGAGFLTRDLRLALIEASQNHIGSFTDQVLLNCYHYDPKTGSYSLMALNVVRLGGLITLAAFGGFLIILWRQEFARAK